MTDVAAGLRNDPIMVNPRVSGPERASRPGIKEVAKRAGVGVASVSRVLSGHPEVSEVMRNRVMDAVAALGYEPDRLAQSMRTGATMTVGFVVGDISNPLMSQIALGAETRMRESGYSMVLTNSGNDPELEAEHISLLQQRRVDALILSVSDEASPLVATALSRVATPVVLVDRQLPDFDVSAVNCDHAMGLTEAFDHLFQLGHRRIGMINGNVNVRPSRERERALRRAARAAGDVSVAIRNGNFSADHGYESTMAMLDRPDAPSVVIAGSNQILVGVLRALRDLDLRIPDDVSLVTCDDITLSEFLTPALATISREPALMGQAAAELLLAEIGGEERRNVVLPTGFRPAASCGPAPLSKNRTT
jgi:LacI family transcriptional regulator